MFLPHEFLTPPFRRRIRQSIMLALASLLLVAVLPINTRAYEGDHYTWTYYLALHVGYTKRQAFQIASGAYAIDWDKETSPMEATPGDAIYGARHPGITGTSHPQIAIIWSRFHAFAETNYVGVGNEVEKARERDRERLWTLAKDERNPGPLIHFVQDYYSNFEFDNVRGHALLGHKPDFISNDPNYKARSMTKATVAVLQRFMREVLGGKPKEPDYARLWEVLDRVAAADPVPNVLYPGNFNPKAKGGFGSPSLDKSLSVVNRAIEEDEGAGRLPRFSGSFTYSLSPNWYQYDYDNEGKVTDALYAVEKPKFETGKEQIEFTPIDQNNFRIKLRVPYELTGLLDLKNKYGSPFLSPLPVFEKHDIVDFDAAMRGRSTNDRLHHRRDGKYAIEIEIQRGRSRLEKGITWNYTIHPYGFKPITRQVRIPVPADIEAVPVPADMKAAPKQTTANFAGDWDTMVGRLGYPIALTLTQSGDKVEGTYTHGSGSGLIKGTVVGDTLTYVWTEGSKKGKGVFSISRDANRISGTYSEEGQIDNIWNGHRRNR